MGFHEKTGYAHRDRRARQHRDELALAAAAAALPARQLYRVGGVEHHRAAGVAHYRLRAHVADQVVVAEAGAALADPAVGVARRPGLVDHGLHFPRRQELALLDFDRLAGFSAPGASFGLASQTRRRL